MQTTATQTLLDAIRRNDLPGVLRALDAGADIEARDSHGKPGLPLRIAAFHGERPIVEALLARGAAPDKGRVVGETQGPAALAAQRGGHSHIVELLLAHAIRQPRPPAPGRMGTAGLRPAARAASPGTEWAAPDTAPLIEEIVIESCRGLDDDALDMDRGRREEGSSTPRPPRTASLPPRRAAASDGFERWLQRRKRQRTAPGRTYS